MASTYVDDDTSKHAFRFLDIDQEPQQILLPIEGYEKMPLVSLEEAVDPLLHLLPDIRRKVWIAKQRCETPSDGLLADESASVCLYSMEWEPHAECLYFVLNATLRDQDREKLKPWFLYLKLILTALARLPSTRLTVYRGVKDNLIKDYPKGKIFVWWGFSSCTSSIDVLQSELFLGKIGKRTMFAIDCYNGKDIRRHSYFKKENEVILLAATQFQVVACLDQGNGLHTIQLKETDPPFPLIQPVTVPNSLLVTTSINQVNKKTTTTAVNKITTPPIDTYHNAKLEERIAQCPLHSTVDLGGQPLTDQDMQIVIKQAIVNQQCTQLWLRDNQIGSEGASILASALHNNTTLKGLVLDDNCVSDKGVQSLAQTLALNKSSLNLLDLSKNSIRDEGAQHLAEMLKTNTTLTLLYLNKNEISDEGVQLFANALAQHTTTLEWLSLSSNKLISDSSVNSLVDMLKHNRSLKTFWMFGCNLSENGKSRLQVTAEEKQGFYLRV